MPRLLTCSARGYRMGAQRLMSDFLLVTSILIIWFYGSNQLINSVCWTTSSIDVGGFFNEGILKKSIKSQCLNYIFTSIQIKSTGMFFLWTARIAWISTAVLLSAAVTVPLTFDPQDQRVSLRAESRADRKCFRSKQNQVSSNNKSA